MRKDMLNKNDIIIKLEKIITLFNKSLLDRDDISYIVNNYRLLNSYERYILGYNSGDYLIDVNYNVIDNFFKLITYVGDNKEKALKRLSNQVYDVIYDDGNIDDIITKLDSDDKQVKISLGDIDNQDIDSGYSNSNLYQDVINHQVDDIIRYILSDDFKGGDILKINNHIFVSYGYIKDLYYLSSDRLKRWRDKSGVGKITPLRFFYKDGKYYYDLSSLDILIKLHNYCYYLDGNIINKKYGLGSIGDRLKNLRDDYDRLI